MLGILLFYLFSRRSTFENAFTAGGPGEELKFGTQEQEEGKASAVAKVGKKVWKKVGPHVKDIAKQAAAGAIEKGAEAANAVMSVLSQL